MSISGRNGGCTSRLDPVCSRADRANKSVDHPTLEGFARNEKAEMKGRRKLWIVAACVLAAVAFVVIRRSREEIVTFRVIYYPTRTPATNLTIRVARRWTTLPIEKLGLPFLKSGVIQ